MTLTSTNRPALPPPLHLEIGSIVTLRMRGHSRTGGLEYFAPAVVLNQHSPNGEIEALVWDSTAGTHYNPNYPIRELSNRERMDEHGPYTEIYELSSNIGAVLFSPDAFSRMAGDIELLQVGVMALQRDVKALLADRAPAKPSAASLAAPAAKEAK